MFLLEGNRGKSTESRKRRFQLRKQSLALEEEEGVWLGQLADYLEPCGHLLAGLWEKTRQGKLGSDIIRFVSFKRSLWLLSGVVVR